MIEALKKKKQLSEKENEYICKIAKMAFTREDTVQAAQAPCTVVGDIHGQFSDLLKLFTDGGDIAASPKNRYVFMGDYVDRGSMSVQTIQLLLCYKARYHDRIYLTRGNHESRDVNIQYGFYAEVMEKYGKGGYRVWSDICDVFDTLPLSVLIDRSVLCVHGGISPSLPTIDKMRKLHRFQDVPKEGPLADLLWSDPDPDTETWTPNDRGAGWLFGPTVTQQFCHKNDIELICRSHQVVITGFNYHFPQKNVATVWSAPNYCGRINSATILAFDDMMNREIIYFAKAAEV